MRRTKKSFPTATQLRLPITGLAFALIFSVCSTDAFAASNSAHSSAKNTKSQAKSKAASLLSAPMSASLDTMPTAPAARSLSVAPPIENGSTRAHKFLKEGARLHRMGEYADAERCFREAVANDPRNPDGFFNLGALAEGRGDLIDALTQYHAGLSIKPNDPALKEAVQAIEKRLAAGERNPVQVEEQHAAFKYPQTMFSNPNPTVRFSQQSPVLTVQPPEVPDLQATNDTPPVLPVGNDGPFQLNSSQNASLPSGGSYGSINALNSNLNASSSQPPVVSIHQGWGSGRRVGGGAMSLILNMGMRSALGGTGLHCPACRLLRF